MAKKRTKPELSTRRARRGKVRPWEVPAPSGRMRRIDPASDAFFSGLNPEQLSVALHTDGPCLVTAGPGTGKTHSMTARVHALALAGANPARVIVMTFTRKAAGEIRARLVRVDPGYAAVRTGTFHSIAIDLVRRYSGISNVVVIDEDEDAHEYLALLFDTFPGASGSCDEETERLFSAMTATRGLFSGDAAPDPYDVGTNAGVMRWLVHEEAQTGTGDGNARVFYGSVSALAQKEGLFPGASAQDILMRLARAFREHKRACGMFSFDDCIVEATNILEGGWGDQVRSCIDYVSVDEYQDSDEAQIRLVEAMCRHNGNIMAVGDAKQSIYCWRGAYPRVFDAFRERWAPREIGLVRNYRSLGRVVDMVNAVVGTGPAARRKELIGAAREGAGTALLRRNLHLSADDAANIVLEKARELGPENVAMLVRSHRSNGAEGASPVLQAVLSRNGIPYRVVGGIKITDRVQFKRFRDTLRILQEPSWALPWAAVIQTLDNAGPVMAAKIAALAKGCPSVAAALDAFRNASVRTRSAREACVLEELVELFSPLSEMDRESEVTAVMRAVLDRILLLADRERKESSADIIGGKSIPSRGRPNPIAVFIGKIAENAPTVEAWLDAVNFEGEGDDEERNAVTISTIHGAKGKEWPVVVVGDLSDDVFPSERSVARAFELGVAPCETVEGMEEHNLLYVAVSRARDELYMTAPAGKESAYVNAALLTLEGYDLTVGEEPVQAPSGVLSFHTRKRGFR